MSTAKAIPGFSIIGENQTVCGPVELPSLVGWVKQGRVRAETWVYLEQDDCWKRAAKVPELRMFFPEHSAPMAPGVPQSVGADVAEVTPAALRRIKALARLSDSQLERFLDYIEIQHLPQWRTVVKHGTPGDAVYFVLKGELRVRLMIGAKEKILATLGIGEFFGEASIFDHGPRSADVVANAESLLVKVSASAFHRLIEEAPDIAAPLLFAMGTTLTSRIRADNKRYRDVVSFVQVIGH